MSRLVLAEWTWARRRQSVRALGLVSLIGVIVVAVQALRGAVIAPSSMFDDVAAGIGTAAVMALFAFAAAVAGSDVQSGALATLATFEPRRAVLVVAAVALLSEVRELR